MIPVVIHAELPPYMNDVPEVIRAFSPHIQESPEGDPLRIELSETDAALSWCVALDGTVDEGRIALPDERLLAKRLAKRAVKNAVYRVLSASCGVSLPYGSLTGVRPTKLFYDLNGSDSYRIQQLIEQFYVSPARAELIGNVVKNQRGYYLPSDDKLDLFVNIPICPTRCKYCSFISTEYHRVKRLVPLYVEAVGEEIGQIASRAKESGKTLNGIYVGGGTPTSLNAAELEAILKPLSHFGVEFTVEAGRPDSVTEEKLKALKDLNVTRISVNPQTLHDRTLQRIGRGHTTADFYRTYEGAAKYGFDINTDLIAGLPGESFEDFRYSLDTVLSLRPENVTVHTLSIKRGAIFKEEGQEKRVDGAVRAMADYAIDTLCGSGYLPYYMYRQKNMADNLENVGYCLPDKQCRYNIDYMEESNTVLSAGAGAVSKFVSVAENRIERRSNAKGFEEYLRRAGKI